MKPGYLLPLLLWLLVIPDTFGKEPTRQSILAKKIHHDLVIDGKLNEEAWRQLSPVTGFWLNFPIDSTQAKNQTQVRILYNTEFLYISAEMYHSVQRSPYIASSLRRDFPFRENDSFGVVIDPYDDRTNGYGFYVSAYNVQRDEQIFNGTSPDATWDVKWSSAVTYEEDRWTIEMAIPLRYLRFRENAAFWNINFLRNDVSENECSTWVATPRFFNPGNLAYSGTLEWPEPVETSARRISLIPSVTARAEDQRHKKTKLGFQPSLDAKFTVTPSLNLDATINPDFSQAEADQTQLNLTRFELVFPEKRLFFVENSDLFSQFGIEKWGTTPIRPFYSRRIGLRYNIATGTYEQTHVLGGLRLSGKLTNDLRIGIMNIQTAQEKIESVEEGRSQFEPAQNYTAIAVQHKVFSRSNVGIIYTQRQAIGDDSISGYRLNKSDFSRLAGIEYNLASGNGNWTGKAFYHALFESRTNGHALGGLIEHTTRRTLSWIGLTEASTAFHPDAGFTPRTGYLNVYGELSYFIYPEKKKINFIQPVLHYSLFLDSLSETKTDHRFITGAQWKWHTTAYLYLLYFNDYTRLTSDFNVSRKDGAPTLPAGTSYSYSYLRVYYMSDIRKKFAWQIHVDMGEFYNGNIALVKGYFNRKIDYRGSIGIDYDATFLRMPGKLAHNNLYLIGPRADISLTRSLFINAVLQYNTQSRSLNFYGKLQWRYRPLSDIFFVYTSNRRTEPWQHENQNVVLKAVWWF